MCARVVYNIINMNILYKNNFNHKKKKNYEL